MKLHRVVHVQVNTKSARSNLNKSRLGTTCLLNKYFDSNNNVPVLGENDW